MSDTRRTSSPSDGSSADQAPYPSRLPVSAPTASMSSGSAMSGAVSSITFETASSALMIDSNARSVSTVSGRYEPGGGSESVVSCCANAWMAVSDPSRAASSCASRIGATVLFDRSSAASARAAAANAPFCWRNTPQNGAWRSAWTFS